MGGGGARPPSVIVATRNSVQLGIAKLATLSLLHSTLHHTSPSLIRPGCDHCIRLTGDRTIPWARLLRCYLWNRLACLTVTGISKMLKGNERRGMCAIYNRAYHRAAMQITAAITRPMKGMYSSCISIIINVQRARSFPTKPVQRGLLFFQGFGKASAGNDSTGALQGGGACVERADVLQQPNQRETLISLCK